MSNSEQFSHVPIRRLQTVHFLQLDNVGNVDIELSSHVGAMSLVVIY
jgi:hypothetical protein